MISSYRLLFVHHLEFLSLKGGCRGSSEPTHVKMPHCSKSHAAAHLSCLLQMHHANPNQLVTLMKTPETHLQDHAVVPP